MSFREVYLDDILRDHSKFKFHTATAGSNGLKSSQYLSGLYSTHSFQNLETLGAILITCRGK